MKKLKQLKQLIEDNYFVEVHQDGDRLWIPVMEDQNKNICIDYYNKQYHISSGGQGFSMSAEDDVIVIYALLKFIKDKHKWGTFENKN